MGRTKLTIVLMLVCAVKCLAMSTTELEDFADYLQKTSQLSPTLKKGVDPDDYDEDETVSDHAWEESGKFEGDLILNERQRRLIVENVAEGLSRNGIVDGTKRWPNNEVIVFIQVEHFTSDQVQAIVSGIDDLARASCVKFRRYRKGDRDAVVIQGSRRGCFSQVGYQGGYQVLNLSARHPVGRGCFRHGTVVHELLHTLGFYHMQSSPDRDDYVDIVWENIVQPARHNFRKYNSFSVSDFGVGYDYDSVLHYSRRAFSSNGQDTIVPKQRGAQIGQRTGLSDKDTQKLNKMYCDADSDKFDDGDDAKPKDKKKKSKSKPFDGHGIGYHQGKAVVIKLVPAAETYKLAHDPSSYKFDHFSSSPQILSTSENEGFRPGKEIEYSYTPPESFITHEYQEPDYITRPRTEFNEKTIEPQIVHHDRGNFEGVSVNDHTNIKNVSETQNDNINPVNPVQNVNAQNLALVEALDRLSKILKSHVYPSQTPDLSVYKMNVQYTKLENDSAKLINDHEEPVIMSPPTKVIMPQGEKMKSAIHFINNLYNIDSKSFKVIEKPQSEKIVIKGDFVDEIKPSKMDEVKDYKEKYIDPSYSKLFSSKDDYESDHVPPGLYSESDEYEKYFAKLIKAENDDEWLEKHSPYRYSPPKYGSQAYTESVKTKEHSGENVYSSFGPSRLSDYSHYHDPYHSKK